MLVWGAASQNFKHLTINSIPNCKFSKYILYRFTVSRIHGVSILQNPMMNDGICFLKKKNPKLLGMTVRE